MLPPWSPPWPSGVSPLPQSVSCFGFLSLYLYMMTPAVALLPPLYGTTLNNVGVRLIGRPSCVVLISSTMALLLHNPRPPAAPRRTSVGYNGKPANAQRPPTGFPSPVASLPHHVFPP